MKVCPVAWREAGGCKLKGRESFVARPPRLDRVESRFHRAPREAPPTLVALSEGAQTGVFAVQHPSLAARKQDTSGKSASGSRPAMLRRTMPARRRCAGSKEAIRL